MADRRKFDRLAKKAQSQVQSAVMDDSTDIAGGIGQKTRILKLDEIFPHPANEPYRHIETSEEDIRQLAEDIQVNGLTHPLIVTRQEGKYYLLSGERRWMACKYLRDNVDADKWYQQTCIEKQITEKDPVRRRALEELIIDGANIQARGGLNSLSDKKAATMIRRRYIQNLMLVENLSELEAGKRLKEVTGHTSDRTIDNDRKLFRQMIPALYGFIYEEGGDISRECSYKLAVFSPAEQTALLETFRSLSDNREMLGESYTYLQAKTVQKAVSLAELVEGEARAEAVAQLREEILTEVQPLLAQNNKDADLQEKPARPHKTREEKQKKHVGTIRKVEKQVAKLTKNSVVSLLRDYEKMPDEEGSVLVSLDHLIQDLTTLRSRISEGLDQ